MKEIKFKNVGVDLRGRQNGMTFSILMDYERVTTGGPAYYVGVHSDTEDFPWLSTWGHRYFDVDSAKEFCRRIAAGKIDVEALRAEFAAEDAAREQAASRPAIPGCSCTRLLSADYSPTSAHLVFTHEGDATLCEFYIDGEPTGAGQPAPEVTELEIAVAVRCAKAFKPELARRYIHAKKKRTRKKYAKRILIWYWGVLCKCSD